MESIHCIRQISLQCYFGLCAVPDKLEAHLFLDHGDPGSILSLSVIWCLCFYEFGSGVQ